MHVPDGFLDVTTSLGTGAVSAGVVVVALRRARDELDERTTPLAGLVAAYVFAAQMLNFPVGVGTSGHLMGGALAAVLVGPWTAVLCLTTVLTVQALLFADGGLSALGTNVLLMGIVTTVVGWLVTKAVLAMLPRRPRSVVPASLVGAAASVPVAALVFVGLYAVGGATPLPMSALVTSMVGWHVLIGAGEGVITALTVGAVLSVRPDLVYAARGLQPDLTLRTPEGDVTVAATSPSPALLRVSTRGLLLGVAGAALVLSGLVSFLASGSPDGLERVAGDRGFLGQARDHAFGGFVLADYGEVGGIPVGVAGVIGVAATVLVSLVVFWLLGRGSRRDERAPSAPAASTAASTASRG
ncbi:MAG: energy-coupling factor ABC transporter permease [Actinomycetes bacterium]